MESRKYCIFLVDDNTINLYEGSAAIQHKYDVVTMPSGEKLLMFLKKMTPDLILLDVEMPGLSGYDVLKKIKSNPETAKIPVIFITGKNDVQDELVGLSLGAVDYITKPFSPPLLLKRIELHLLLKEREDELRKFNNNLLELVNERTRDISTLQNAVIVWAAEVIEFRDENTGQHVKRVQKYLELLLTEMVKIDRYMAEVTTWDFEAFYNSALLHDVGKIKISDEILLKEAQLSRDEFDNMKLHSLYGKMLLEKLEEQVPNQVFLEYAKTLAYRHHERWDGDGYPDHLKGEEIPLQARMMAIADVYDALISERAYKYAFSHEEAIHAIKDGSGTQFDPDLTALFISLSDRVKEISMME